MMVFWGLGRPNSLGPPPSGSGRRPPAGGPSGALAQGQALAQGREQLPTWEPVVVLSTRHRDRAALCSLLEPRRSHTVHAKPPNEEGRPVPSGSASTAKEYAGMVILSSVAIVGCSGTH